MITPFKSDIFLDALFERLKSADSGEAAELVQAIGHIGDTASVPRLISLLTHDTLRVREMALWSLESITGQQLGYDPAPWWKWEQASSSAKK